MVARKLPWAVLVAGVWLATACAASAPAASPGTAPHAGGFLLALPRVIVDLDQEGHPSMFGVKLRDAGFALGPQISRLQLNRFYVDWMTAANVQHIEFRQTGHGLTLLINGAPMPYLVWREDAMRGAAQIIAASSGQDARRVEWLLAIGRRLGANLVLRFPRRPGMKTIPLADGRRPIASPAAEPALVLFDHRFEIIYDPGGAPSFLGISPEDLARLGLIEAPFALTPTDIATLRGLNLQHVELRSRPDGLTIYGNSRPVLHLAWNDDLLNSSAALYAQMNPRSPYIPLVNSLAPSLRHTHLSVLVHFPPGRGAAPIPIRMHR